MANREKKEDKKKNGTVFATKFQIESYRREVKAYHLDPP